MTMDELMQKILNILPDAQFEDDNDGQIVIYTGLTQTSDERVVPMEEAT